MEQHAIPQQISSYEFKLVGEMTLKQFMKAAGGIVIALIINSSKLFVLIKWPLMLIIGGAGLAFAFVPYQDRPLEKWVWLFFRAIYQPTIYIYRKTVNKQDSAVMISLAKTKDQEEKRNSAKLRLINQKGIIKDFIENIPSVKITVKEAEKKKAEEIEPIKKVKTLEDLAKEASDTMVDTTKETVSVDAWRTQKANLGLSKEKLEATGKVVFGEIPMPDMPEIPNIVVGMATDLRGKIVEGAIVEIQDEHGNPNRVLKTNSLGQFKTSSPLLNGKYLIICEKDGHDFDRVDLILDGRIVQPIKIISK
jgi:hypothetical protein